MTTKRKVLLLTKKTKIRKVSNYLGALVTSYGRGDKDVLQKIARGRIINNRLNSFLWNKIITNKLQSS